MPSRKLIEADRMIDIVSQRMRYVTNQMRHPLQQEIAHVEWTRSRES
jgi:hypothetical protein